MCLFKITPKDPKTRGDSISVKSALKNKSTFIKIKYGAHKKQLSYYNSKTLKCCSTILTSEFDFHFNKINIIWYIIDAPLDKKVIKQKYIF